ncbi:MAG: dihydrofolate reductase [Gemmatimonadetes bacterium]|nr:dihydrofolate reductase [Gemmatimonadota bacterium]
MILSLIAAMAQNRVIGRNHALPWHLPADLQRFKSLTMGHTVLLGRKTFDTIGKPLPGRRWIVLTRDRGWRHAGVDVAHDLDEALPSVARDVEVFVAGGAEVYAQALPRADRIYLTVIHAEIEGDARFPALDLSEWRLVDDERHQADARHAFSYSFRRYERVKRETGKGKGET